MATQAKIGFGSLFEIQDLEQSPDGWVKVAEVTNITPPNFSRDAVDATHTESEEGWREFIPGLKDGGEVTVEMNFIPGAASTDRIFELFSRDVGDFRISFPDGSPSTVWQFKAFITGFEPEAPLDDKMSATATFKLTGKPAFLTNGSP